MRTIDHIQFEVNRWEIVEFVDGSVRAAKKGRRGDGKQESYMIWETDLPHNKIILKLRLVVKTPDGDLLLKFVLRGHYTILGTEEIAETQNLMLMSKAATLAIAHEVWDYAMDYLSKRPTPIRDVSIRCPPDESLITELKFPGFSLN